eukprot:COSAG05_NODE_900_length_6670_cov_2.425963_1_plen_168_part_10
MPEEDQSDCRQCQLEGDNMHSSDGVSCVACSPGTEPLENRSACISCEVVGAAYVSSTGAQCTMCRSGQFPLNDRKSCRDCPFGEVSRGANCSGCEPGFEPNSATSECASCRGLDSADGLMKFHSTDGVTCEPCWPNSRPASEIDRSRCVCMPGFVVNQSNLLQCIDID